MRGPAVRPIVIAAGGTGGHFFPAEALASALLARGHRVILLTDARTGARLGSAFAGSVFAGGEYHVLSGAGIAGRGITRAARALMSLAAGTLQARKILSRLDAACVIGFGGYPSVPPILAARSLRRRPGIILHEQNAVLGRANRFCAGAADLLALGFADTSRVPSRAVTIFTGNPVRPAIQALAGISYVPPSDRIELLVMGGSLGAHIFTDIVPAAIGLLAASLRSRLRVVQQCRSDDLVRTRELYEAGGVDAELSAFFPDIAERLAAAHIVISRAGASTCAELAVTGRPAILVPLPGAIDDHQAANARALTGACVIAQADFTPAALSERLTRLLSDPAALSTKAATLAAIGRPGSADDLADAVETLAARAETPR